MKANQTRLTADNTRGRNVALLSSLLSHGGAGIQAVRATNFRRWHAASGWKLAAGAAEMNQELEQCRRLCAARQGGRRSTG